MRRFICAIGILAAALSASTAFAAITYNGGATGLSPASGWSSSTTGYVGYHATGSITVDQTGTPGGTLASSTAYIGGAASSYSTVTGTVTVIGGAATSSWTNSGSLYVGYYGTGNLSLQNGGTLSTAASYIAYSSNANCSGTATIDGAYSGTPSTWTTNSNPIYVGYNQTGILKITNGGSVTDSYGYIGGYTTTASGSGTVTVDGMNGSTPSTWNDTNVTSSVYVGYNGTGGLNVTNGGYVSSSGTAYLGYNSAKTGTVTVDGINGSTSSTWSAATGLYVGYNGTGVLHITNGGSVNYNSINPYLGYNSSGSGTVTVDGVNNGIPSQLTCTGNANQLDVGYNGAGVLTITNGGQVTNTGIGYVGGTTSVGNTSTGTVTIDGSSGGTASKWTCGYTFYGAAYGSASGSVKITNGGSLSTGYGRSGTEYPAYIANGNTSNFSATVDGANSTWNENGSIDIGYGTSATGSLQISNGETVNTATSGTFPYTIVGYSANATGSLKILNGGSSTRAPSTSAVPRTLAGQAAAAAVRSPSTAPIEVEHLQYLRQYQRLRRLPQPRHAEHHQWRPCHHGQRLLVGRHLSRLANE